jgi:SpoIIAA-like
MIERISDLPDTVLGFAAKGKVTAEDYESVLVPAVEAAIAERHKIRLLYQLGPDLSGFEAGALWDDAKVGLRHATAWERVAVVTDVEWIRVATKVFGFAIPGEVRVFRNGEMAAAREWLSA